MTTPLALFFTKSASSIKPKPFAFTACGSYKPWLGYQPFDARSNDANLT